MIVGELRALNNLLEKMHQSFYFYLLPSTTKYISIGVYMIPLALLILPMLTFGFYLVFRISRRSSVRGFLAALIPVLVLQLAGLLCYATPFVVQRSLNRSLEPNEMVQALVAVFVLVLSSLPLVVRSVRKQLGDEPLDRRCYKLFSVFSVILFITTRSIENFSFSAFAAAFVVPFYTACQPTSNRLVNIVQLLLLVLVSPVALLLLAGGESALFAMVNEHAKYGNLTMPFVLLIYLPLNLAHVLFFALA
jgi:glycosylphosphatidylinositol transamidase